MHLTQQYFTLIANFKGVFEVFEVCTVEDGALRSAICASGQREENQWGNYGLSQSCGLYHC